MPFDIKRLPAHDLEAAVVQRLANLLRDRAAIRRLVAGQDSSAAVLASAIAHARTTAAKLETHHGRRTLVGMLVRETNIDDRQIAITIDRHVLLRTIGAAEDGDAELVITTATVRVRHGKDVKLVLADEQQSAQECDDALTSLLAEAHAARTMVLDSPALTIKEIAARQGLCRSRMAKLVRLSWLTPDMVRAIAAGEHPARLTPRRLLEAELPACWTAQAAMLDTL